MPPIPSNVVHPQAEPREPAGEQDTSSYVTEESTADLAHPTADAAVAGTVDQGESEAALAGVMGDHAGEEQAAVSDAAKGSGRRSAKQRRPAQRRRHQQQDGPGDVLGPLAIFAAVAAGSWLLWQLLRRRKKSAVPMTRAPTVAALVGRLAQLPAAPPQPPPAAPQPLAGATFAIADKYSLARWARRLTTSVPQHVSHKYPAAMSAKIWFLVCAALTLTA